MCRNVLWTFCNRLRNSIKIFDLLWHFPFKDKRLKGFETSMSIVLKKNLFLIEDSGYGFIFGSLGNFITKRNRCYYKMWHLLYYKMRQFFYSKTKQFYLKMPQLLQNVSISLQMWKLLRSATLNTVGQIQSINQSLAIANETYRSFREGFEIKGVCLDISKVFDKI